MSVFSRTAALVKSAVLSTFGDDMQLYSSDQLTMITPFKGVILERVEDATEFVNHAQKLKVLKMDKRIEHLVKTGLQVRDKQGNWYRLAGPADLRKFSRAGINNDHFITWNIR